MKTYIVRDLNDPEILKIETRTDRPASYVADALLDAKGDAIPIDELDVFKECVKTGKRLGRESKKKCIWVARIDAEKRQLKKANKKAESEGSAIEGAINLPSFSNFIAAYLAEKDGNPLPMSEILKQYVLSKRVK